MVLAKSKNSVGLGNSLMNDRFGKGRGADRKKVSAPGIQRTGPGGETYVTNEKKEASWVKMRSVTEQAALDEFLSTAELAGTDFTAEKLNNVRIVHADQRNPYLLSARDERRAVRAHNARRARLTVPRRPPWSSGDGSGGSGGGAGATTRGELEARERESLLGWRRGLAELQEEGQADLLLTPFERNLEVWRQLWRVIERSDLVVQIVDARSPLLFRCEDLERYVKEVDRRKENLLLVNKADMMTQGQRQAWADYFQRAGINYKFFSAQLAKESNESRDEDEIRALVEQTRNVELEDGKESKPAPESVEDEQTRILTVEELEMLFLEQAPSLPPSRSTSPTDSQPTTNSKTAASSQPRKTVIGLVGYPNVGKSSTINALLGHKRVSVSSTPGKTKHFQTHHLSSEIILCDCPGLVFPNFATTKAELVLAGVLPIDQQREFTGPVGLLARRIPKEYLEAKYGISINVRPEEEGGTGIPTSEETLVAYAKARGYSAQGRGSRWDTSRAARFILKDYVNGKLPFVHPPPAQPNELAVEDPEEEEEDAEDEEGFGLADGSAIDPAFFNRELHDPRSVAKQRKGGKRQQQAEAGDDESVALGPAKGSEKSARIDAAFFARGSGNAGHISLPPHLRNKIGAYAARPGLEDEELEDEEGSVGAGKQLSGRKMREMVALDRGLDAEETRRLMGGGSKKHFKGGKKAKARKEKDLD